MNTNINVHLNFTNFFFQREDHVLNPSATSIQALNLKALSEFSLEMPLDTNL